MQPPFLKLYLVAMLATSRCSKSLFSEPRELTLGDIGLTVGDIDVNEEEQDERQDDEASEQSLAVSL